MALSLCVHVGGLVATRYAPALDVEPGRIDRSAAAWRAPLEIVDFPPPTAAPDPDLAARPDPTLQPEPPELAKPPPPPLTLGIDDSDAVTDNVLGFADPTPHMAPQSEIDQPALDPEAGASSAPALAQGTPGASPNAAADAAQVGPPRPAEFQFSSAAQPPGTGDEDRELVEPARTETGEPTPPGPGEGLPDTQMRAERAEGEGDLADRLQERLEAMKMGPPRPPELSEAVTDADRPGSDQATRPATAQPGTVGLPGDGGDAPQSQPAISAEPGKSPGIKSDKQADPVARDKPIEIRPGQPAAAEGLDIVTRKPVFTKLTLMTASPANPTINITFDRMGRVTNVTVTKSSGREDVDEPIVNAAYQWRARGPKLAQLTEADPKATITIAVTILLR